MYPVHTLEALCAALPNALLEGQKDVAVSRICHDSRQVVPGALFVCLKGATHDGHAFASEAVARGAVALAVNADAAHAVTMGLPREVPRLVVPDTRRALPILACAFYQHPSHRLTMIGVTGTNGKTTTVRMIASILRAAGQKVGTIGTLGAELDGEPMESAHTTPEADQLQELLYRMVEGGAQAVAMEVSSHALAQFRTDGIAFNAGVFTNITQDHLDFHGTMEAYFQAKARLFTEYPVLYPRPDGQPFVNVINVTAWEGRDLVTMARGEIITFSTGHTPAVLTASDVVLSPSAIRFTLHYDAGVERWALPLSLPVGGAFQVANALAAVGATVRLGVPVDAIVQGLAHLPPVPGRFEAVPTGGRGFSVIVDYAHTPDGLENLLRSARELEPGRILLVFGCGGNRDRTKRPQMGRIAGTLADVAIVTSDNPRHEDPNAIIAEILSGMDATKDPAITAQVQVEPDRRAAITLAIQQARPGDLVLIAGKGHEDYQIVGDAVLPFDDRQVTREVLATLP
ncbi:MAG: UDP-N-acetylmuramoyl-L-alanyl-D-glutamate--2,6-diaminopimelate ligase [Chloroherpetonaceae bacterium]|nr:UDP-N-acetylmuramoyl-L-alanyl-D-glutamate--2,6-diaminopimelate ligase [Chthonomonadaceae bacterium]MDW8208437.1 UDP-N-acetylmuramoyl-L-alanyl-D-glutamate--2,6-diaminopimelate ligase [Chloroherpetonaceae bacterium]